MSNVLIGIIGVILFIGLALAGALFLGPRFQEAQIESKASAGVQVMTQMAQSFSMMHLDDGSQFRTGTSMYAANPESPVAKGYLKSIPKGPTNPLWGPFTADKDSLSSGGPAVYVAMTLDPSDNSMAEKVCLRIVRQSGQDPNATTVPTGTTIPTTAPAGCFRTVPGAVGTFSSGYFYLYSRI